MERIKHDIILTSISPFGQDGPYANYEASELVCWSMGGYTWMVGDEDRPPVQISFPQAYLHASAEAAAATLIGHYHRLITGEGQHIDVSIQACVARDLMNAPLFWEILRGRMSLVGTEIIRWEPSLKGRGFKPGLTGLVQINQNKNLSNQDKEKYNLYYLRNYSLLLDLEIIIRTIFH